MVTDAERAGEISMQMSGKTHIGYIGFFDILGYQDLLKNNEPEDIADKVLGFINESVHQAKKLTKSDVDRMLFAGQVVAVEAIKSSVRRIDSLVFSDTILLTLGSERPEEALQNGTSSRILPPEFVAFYWTSVTLQKLLFEEGLPVRGALNYGPYYMFEQTFAGGSIVEAYRLCNSLEIATSVLHEKLEMKAKEVNPDLNALSPSYKVPTKDGIVQLHTVPLIISGDKDLRTFVFKAFYEHKKDIGQGARLKANNTIEWLKYIQDTKRRFEGEEGEKV